MGDCAGAEDSTREAVASCGSSAEGHAFTGAGDLALLRRCWRSFDIVLDAYVGAEATCNVPEHVARSLEHSDCKTKAPVMRREEQRDERLNL